MSHYYYIAIVAPFGSGKTTLMEYLSGRFKGFYPVYSLYNTDHLTIEDAEVNHPEKVKYNKDFIQSRILDNDATTIINTFKENYNDENTRPGIIIGDSSYHEHYCYIMALYQHGKLKSREYKRLMFKFKAIRNSLPNPDMFIYVDVPLDTIMLNIKKRNRGYETVMKDKELRKYIWSLKTKYENLLFSRRNYRYDHSMLQHVFRYQLGSAYQKQQLKVEEYIKNQCEVILGNMTQKNIPLGLVDREYTMKYIGGTKCK